MEYYGIIICPFCKEISKMSQVMSDWYRTERISLILEFLNIPSITILMCPFLHVMSLISLYHTYQNFYFIDFYFY